MLQYQYYNNIISITVVMSIYSRDYNIAMLLFTGHGPGPSGVVWCGQVCAEYGQQCIPARYSPDTKRLLPASVLPPFLLMCWLSV